MVKIAQATCEFPLVRLRGRETFMAFMIGSICQTFGKMRGKRMEGAPLSLCVLLADLRKVDTRTLA